MPTMPTTVRGGDGSPPQWSYTGPQDTDVDTVRFYLQDTDPAMPLLGDLDIQYLIDVWMPKYDSLVYVAKVAADRISAKFVGVVTVSADGVSVDVSSLSDRYTALAARLEQAHKEIQVGGEVDLTNLMWAEYVDFGIKPLSFGVGMHDNLEAGRQEYGSERAVYSYEDTVRPGG